MSGPAPSTSTRWLYHVLRTDEPGTEAALGEAYAPASLAREGFIHASYQSSVVESARLTHPSVLSVSGTEANPTYRDPADYLFGDPR